MRSRCRSVFGSGDVGFAEGSGIADADLPRRLDGMDAYVGDKKPIIRIDIFWGKVQDVRHLPAELGPRSTPVVDAAARAGLRSS